VQQRVPDQKAGEYPGAESGKRTRSRVGTLTEVRKHSNKAHKLKQEFLGLQAAGFVK
jgi:hypothetical protein